MSLERVPSWIGEQYAGGVRGFKENKRAHLRKALAELEEFRMGCAYLPDGAGAEFQQAMKLLHLVRVKISVKEWGR